MDQWHTSVLCPGTSFLVIQGLAVLAGLIWCVRFWINPECRLRFPPVAWFVVLFAGYAVARYLTADVEYVARKELVRVLVYALLFFVLVNLTELQKSADCIVLTWIGAGLLACYHLWILAKLPGV